MRNPLATPMTTAEAGARGHARLKERFLQRAVDMYPDLDEPTQARIADEAYRAHWKLVGTKGHAIRTEREAARRAAKATTTN